MPLTQSDLAVLTNTEAFYDTFRQLGEGLRGSSTPPPDVTAAPWEILAPIEGNGDPTA